MIEEEEISGKILELVVKNSPETVERLIDEAHRVLGTSNDVLLRHVIELQNQGKLNLTTPPESIPDRLSSYAISSHATWFWVIIVLAFSTIVTIFTISETTYPVVYIRYVLGSIFVLFLPGYTLIKTLFPTREIDGIERTALSIGMSLALVPLVGLIFNYTPWGIRLTPIALSLLALTTILSITGLVREYQAKYPEQE